MPPISTCSLCDVPRELFRGRHLIKGYELREYVCAGCGSTVQMVVRCENLRRDGAGRRSNS
ncbi:MAG TPA: hypothetical protein VGC77_11745 [Rhodopseudomonas sp.]|uniref:hypothetical protein n=1 Tax=Rhodopseudomonas sp. TaxID=1078 RepID=UPI002ED88A4E